MLSIQELKSDKKYKEIFSVTPEECKAMELLALQDGEIYQPLIVWKGEDILIYGYQYLEMLIAHPEIKYTIRELDFEDWQEAKIWAVEHYIALPETRLWQKLEAAVKCEEYWLLKMDAKNAQGKRTDLSTVTIEKSDQSKEVAAIIAEKVGCSVGYVYNFKKIFSSGQKDIIALCRKGEMSINKAYSQLFLPKKPKPAKPSSKTAPDFNTPMELVIEGSDIFDECENNIEVGKKSTTRHNGIPVDPFPVAEQMKTAKVPDGAIWITLHKKNGQMQVVKKTNDEVNGKIRTKVNAYNCKIISENDDLIILEADHINGSTTEQSHKDEHEFETLSQMAS